MSKTFRSAAAALALIAVPAQAAAPAAAQMTKTPCLSEAEVRALTAFAMPSALGGMIKHCSPHVGSNAFMARSGSSLVASYAANKGAAWPLARKAFFRIAGDKDKDTTAMMANLPDTALQPFVEGMIGGLVGAKLKPGQCVMADKMMQLLAPLPAANTVELIGTIIGLVGNDKKAAPGGLTICQA